MHYNAKVERMVSMGSATAAVAGAGGIGCGYGYGWDADMKFSQLVN